MFVVFELVEGGAGGGEEGDGARRDISGGGVAFKIRKGAGEAFHMGDFEALGTFEGGGFLALFVVGLLLGCFEGVFQGRGGLADQKDGFQVGRGEAGAGPVGEIAVFFAAAGDEVKGFLKRLDARNGGFGGGRERVVKKLDAPSLADEFKTVRESFKALEGLFDDGAGDAEELGGQGGREHVFQVVGAAEGDVGQGGDRFTQEDDLVALERSRGSKGSFGCACLDPAAPVLFSLAKGLVRAGALVICVQNGDVLGFLVVEQRFFGAAVLFPGCVVIEVVTGDIEKNGQVWAFFEIFELKAGEFQDYEALRRELVQEGERRLTDVAAQVNVATVPHGGGRAGGFEHFVKEACGGAFAFGPGDAEYGARAVIEKITGEAGYEDACASGFLENWTGERDARGAKNQVKIAEVLKSCWSEAGFKVGREVFKVWIFVREAFVANRELVKAVSA